MKENTSFDPQKGKESKTSKIKNLNDFIGEKSNNIKKNNHDHMKTKTSLSSEVLEKNKPAVQSELFNSEELAHLTKNVERECPICFEALVVVNTAPCSHSICLFCYLRLIIFMNIKECVVCRNKNKYTLLYGDIVEEISEQTGISIFKDRETGKAFIRFKQQAEKESQLFMKVNQQKNAFQKTFLAQLLIFPSDLSLDIPECEWINKKTEKEKTIRKLKIQIKSGEIELDQSIIQNSTVEIEKNNILSVLLLLSHSCKTCLLSFSSRSLLIAHYKQEHQIFLCDLCVFNKPVFWYEYKTYSEQKYKAHRSFWAGREITPKKSKIKKIDDLIPGKSERRSQNVDSANEEGFLGHPVCPFCSLQVYSLSDLHSHLHSTYHLCTLCEVNNLRSIFYKNFQELKKHNECHYSCYLCKDYFFFRGELVVHLRDVHKIKRRVEEINHKDLKADGYNFNRVRTLQGNSEQGIEEEQTSKSTNYSSEIETISPVNFPSFSSQQIPDYLNVTLSDNLKKTLFLRVRNILKKNYSKLKTNSSTSFQSLNMLIENILKILSKDETLRINYDALTMIKPKERVMILKEFNNLYGLHWIFSDVEKEAYFPSFGLDSKIPTTSNINEETKKKEEKDVEKKFRIFSMKKK